MKKKMKQIWIGFGVVALLGMLCWMPLAADAARTEKKPPAVDSEVYADFMASQPRDIKDLVDEAEAQRDFFNRITPPNVLLFQPMMPSVMPFDDADFSDAFLDDLLGEDKNSVAVYPLSLSLDPKTRKTLIYNAEGKLIATLPATKGSRTEAKESDPSRVTLLLDLLPSEDVEPYLYTESRIEESLTAVKARTPKSGGMAMKSLGASEFGISGIQTLTNGNIRITVSNGTDFAELFSYTVESTSAAFSGIESAWECQTTNLVLTNGVAVWEDTTISSNARIRFYAVAQRTDTDADGLTDGAEILMHRTDPGMADTDGDEMPDGWEVQYSLDPQDPADAELDPDNDHLVNREEYELGLGINTSNEVVMVYFNPNPPPEPMGMGGSGNAQYITFSNLQAKAVKTIRYKEGYEEFTDETLPPSDPPKWYLSREWTYQAAGDGYEVVEDTLNHYIHSAERHCLKEFSPNSWPSSPTNHICTGAEHLANIWTSVNDWGDYGFDYIYSQPDENFQITTYDNHYSIHGSYSSPGTLSLDTCLCPLEYSFEVYSHTEMGVDDSWDFELWGAIDPDAYQVALKTLSNEYTNGLLFTYTTNDLALMPSITNLNWGQRWARDNHRQEPYMETLPTNEIFSAYLISEDEDEMQLQELSYKWTIETETNVHYKLMWLEAYRPQNSDTFTCYDLKTDVFTGDGNIHTSETYQAKFPWEMDLPWWETDEPYGTVEPIGFLVQLECDLAENPKVAFGYDPPDSPCFPVWAEEELAAKTDQNKINSALTVFFSEASTPEGDPTNFNVTLRVYPEDLPGVTWEKTSGPNSGTLLDCYQPIATFSNATKGGLYTFSTTIPGVDPIISQLWFPVSGPDISVNFQNEIDYLVDWKPRYLTNLHQRVLQKLSSWHLTGNSLMYEGTKWSLKIIDMKNLGPKYDFELVSDTLMQDVCGLANVPPTNNQAKDSSRLVLSGNDRPYVTDFAKRNNMGYAMCARAQGLAVNTITNGPNLYQSAFGGIGTMDDQYAISSYMAGVALMDGSSLTQVMDTYGRFMQHPNMRISKEWPSDETTAVTYINLSTNLLNELEKLAGGTP